MNAAVGKQIFDSAKQTAGCYVKERSTERSLQADYLREDIYVPCAYGSSAKEICHIRLYDSMFILFFVLCFFNYTCKNNI